MHQAHARFIARIDRGIRRDAGMLASRDLPDLGIVLSIGNSLLNHQTCANGNQSLAVSSESRGIFQDISRRLCLALLTADLFCLHVQTENCIHTVLEFDTDYRNRLPVFSRDERDSQTKNLVLASLMIRNHCYTKKCK